MSGLRSPLGLGAAAMAIGVVLVAIAFTAGRGGAAGPTLGPGPATVELHVQHSRFEPDHVTVRPGTDVRFVVVNDDPINHECIVGDEEVHLRHENGTEASHPPRPGEVSIPAGQTAETTFSFPKTGDVVFACHLPGHFKYGMRGLVTVTEA